MKVKEFAEAQGITTQAVYQRLKKHCVKTSQKLSVYISPDTSEITEDGYTLLKSLYKAIDKPEAKQGTFTKQSKQQISSLQADLKQKEDTINRLQSDLKHATETIDYQKRTIEGLQQDKIFLQTLLDSLARRSEEKPTLLQRLFGRKSPEKKAPDPGKGE